MSFESGTDATTGLAWVGIPGTERTQKASAG
ncbi:hypothetical protein GGQ68_002325 [Sagittula marina]|uniref:Uncharacterized protein n=1 Tax=Sagittula marina TaxID=943940 RepID=A0A7W6DNH6_9RHOB|nr:hypothetical protein [Sagittula marina]